MKVQHIILASVAFLLGYIFANYKSKSSVTKDQPNTPQVTPPPPPTQIIYTPIYYRRPGFHHFH